MIQNSRIISLPLENPRMDVKKGDVLGYKVVSGKLVVAKMAAGYEYIGVSADVNYAQPAEVQVPVEVRLGVAINGMITAKVEEAVVAGDKLEAGVDGGFAKHNAGVAVAIAVTPALTGGVSDVILL